MGASTKMDKVEQKIDQKLDKMKQNFDQKLDHKWIRSVISGFDKMEQKFDEL
jgi:GTP-binding protein EngB required for normal cell division